MIDSTKKVQQQIDWNKAQRVGALNRLQFAKGAGVSPAFLKHVLRFLEDCQGGSSECWPKQSTIATSIGGSIRQVRTAIKWLAQMELIQVDRRWNETAGATMDHYAILWGNVSQFEATEEQPTNRQFLRDQPANSVRPTGNFCATNRQIPSDQPANSARAYIREPIREPSSSSMNQPGRFEEEGSFSVDAQAEPAESQPIDPLPDFIALLGAQDRPGEQAALRQTLAMVQAGRIDVDAFEGYLDDVLDRMRRPPPDERVRNPCAYLLTAVSRDVNASRGVESHVPIATE